MSGEIVSQESKQEQKPKTIPIYLALIGMFLMGLAVGGVLVYHAVNGNEQNGVCIPKGFYGVLYPEDYFPGDDYFIFNRTNYTRINVSVDKGNYSCPLGLGGIPCDNPYKNW